MTDLIQNMNLDSPSDEERDFMTYLPPALQAVFDGLVIDKMKWKAVQHEEVPRRMWFTRGVIGTVGNLTAARFLEQADVDWKSALLDGTEERRKAA